jgi:branched-chain amino acid transport system substrate-binding protein
MPSARRLVLVLAPALALAGCTPKGTPEPIVVGQLVPLSGPDRAAGEQAKQGVDLAVDEANREENRITGRPVNVVQVNTADPETAQPQTARGTGGESDPVQAQTVRVLTVNHALALLGGIDSDQLGRISRASQSYGTPLVSHATLADPSNNDYVFSTTVTPAYQGQVLARFARDDLKPAGVTALTDSRGSVSGMLTTAFIKEAGNAFPVDQWTYRGEADFADLVARAKKAQPKAVLVAGSAADLVKLRPQLREAAPQAPLLFGTEEGSLPALAEDRSTPGTAYLASAYAAEGLTAKGQEVARQYRERFGQDLDVHAALAYDDARVLFEAMRRAKSTSTVLVRKELLGLEGFESLTGPLSFAKEHSARRPVFVLRLEEGRPRLAKRYDPEGK